MRQDKLTTKFQEALADAQSLAVGRDHQFIEPVHLLSALIDQRGGSARSLLDKAGARVPKLKSDLNALLDRMPRVEGSGGEVVIGNDLARLLNVTDKLAQQRGDQHQREVEQVRRVHEHQEVRGTPAVRQRQAPRERALLVEHDPVDVFFPTQLPDLEGIEGHPMPAVEFVEVQGILLTGSHTAAAPPTVCQQHASYIEEQPVHLLRRTH